MEATREEQKQILLEKMRNSLNSFKKVVDDLKRAEDLDRRNLTSEEREKIQEEEANWLLDYHRKECDDMMSDEGARVGSHLLRCDSEEARNIRYRFVERKYTKRRAMPGYSHLKPIYDRIEKWEKEIIDRDFANRYPGSPRLAPNHE